MRVTQARDGVGLGRQPVLGADEAFLAARELDGHLALGGAVPGLPHLAHATLADLLDQLVAIVEGARS